MPPNAPSGTIGVDVLARETRAKLLVRNIPQQYPGNSSTASTFNTAVINSEIDTAARGYQVDTCLQSAHTAV